MSDKQQEILLAVAKVVGGINDLVSILMTPQETKAESPKPPLEKTVSPCLDTKKYWTARQVMSRTGLSRATLHRYTHAGYLPGEKVPCKQGQHKFRWVWASDVVERWVKDHPFVEEWSDM